MSRTKAKTRGANLPVPQNRDEAAEAVKTFGVVTRQIARIEHDLNDHIAEQKRIAEEAAAPLKEKAEALQEGLKIWAEANRDKITDGGKVKFADLGTGKISWRNRPAKVRLSKVEAVIAALKKLGLQRFIRTSEEVDKEAMLKETAAARLVPGVSIGSEGEDFYVEPFEVDLAAGKVGA